MKVSRWHGKERTVAAGLLLYLLNISSFGAPSVLLDSALLPLILYFSRHHSILLADSSLSSSSVHPPPSTFSTRSLSTLVTSSHPFFYLWQWFNKVVPPEWPCPVGGQLPSHHHHPLGWTGLAGSAIRRQTHSPGHLSLRQRQTTWQSPLFAKTNSANKEAGKKKSAFHLFLSVGNLPDHWGDSYGGSRKEDMYSKLHWGNEVPDKVELEPVWGSSLKAC